LGGTAPSTCPPHLQHSNTHNELNILSLDRFRLLDLEGLKGTRGLGSLGPLDLAALERERCVLELC
jgi:hypothetical protein